MTEPWSDPAHDVNADLARAAIIPVEPFPNPLLPPLLDDMFDLGEWIRAAVQHRMRYGDDDDGSIRYEVPHRGDEVVRTRRACPLCAWTLPTEYVDVVTGVCTRELATFPTETLLRAHLVDEHGL